MSTLIVFSATWCPPCQRYKPAINEIEALTEIHVRRIDIDEHPEMASHYGVKSVPTTILEDDSDTELCRKAGVMTADDLYAFISP